MKRIAVKIIINICLHQLISIIFFIIGQSDKAISHAAAFKIEVSVIALFQLPIYLTYRIFPLKSKKHKIEYWIVSLCLTAYTSWFWICHIVGPLWL